MEDLKDGLYIEKPDKIFFDGGELIVKKDWIIKTYYNSNIFWTTTTKTNFNYANYKLQDISEEQYYKNAEKILKEINEEEERRQYLKLKAKYEQVD